MSREELFFDAITNIREELVEEAQRYVFRRKRVWRRYMGLAACVAVIAAVCFGAYSLSGLRLGGGDDGVPGADEPEACEDESTHSLVGVVLEVHETYLLVSWEEPVEVPTEGLEDLPEFHEGNMVDVRCEELVSRNGVLAASGVEGIWLVEP